MMDPSFPHFVRVAIERLQADESLRTPEKLDLLLDHYAKTYAMDAEPLRQAVHAWCTQRFEAFRLTNQTFAQQFRIGRNVAAALPVDCSVLRPHKAGLRDAAKACGLTQKAARRALDAFNFGAVT